MKEKITSELEQLLMKLRPNELSAYYKDYSIYMADEKKGFYYYFKDIIAEKKIFLKDVYTSAGVTESYGSKIITMRKHTKNRDLIIRLCLAGHFSLDEINRALKLYGMNPLYAKSKRDACIIIAITHRIFGILDVDEILKKNGFPILSVET